MEPEAQTKGITAMEQQKPFENPIRILHLLDGARQATGTAVIIDVFRAFSLEACLLHWGAACVRPVDSVEQTLRLHEAFPGSVLIGERGGKKIEGFDFGNSPSTVPPEAVAGKVVLHTTSAGTQGVIAASGASELLGGSLLTARATVEYLKKTQPDSVSLVAMGLAGNRTTEEDELCARYLQALLQNEPFPDLAPGIERLKETDGKKFFDPTRQHIFPEQDFWMCVEADRFPFAVRFTKDEWGYLAQKVII